MDSTSVARANYICALLAIACCVSAICCLSGVILIAVGAEKSTELSKEFCEYSNCEISIKADSTIYCHVTASVSFGELVTTVDRNINCDRVDVWQKQCNGGDAFCYKYEDKLYVNKPTEAMNLIYIGIAILIMGICSMVPACIIILLSCNMSEFE